MNFNFEKDTLELLASNDYNIVYDDNLTTLSGMTLAIDASILLRMASKSANAQKFIQEGGSSLDLEL
jgi:hypothetical protein